MAARETVAVRPRRRLDVSGGRRLALASFALGHVGVSGLPMPLIALHVWAALAF